MYGELVYAVPNDASAQLLNSETIEGHIALVDRGEVPLATKVRRAQEAGAVGIVIVDDGGCTEQYDCGVLGAQRNGRFSATDHAQLWRKIRIPAVLLLKSLGDRIKTMMELESINLGPELGLQQMEVE